VALRDEGVCPSVLIADVAWFRANAGLGLLIAAICPGTDAAGVYCGELR
jgi:hypothetical protein